MNQNKAREILRARLKAAFPIQHPGRRAIVTCTFWIECSDCKTTRRVFDTIVWPSLQLETLRRYSESIFFLSNKGFQYYLPAFLSYALDGPEHLDVMFDYLISMLCLPTPADNRWEHEQFTARTSSLSREQKMLVADSLEYIAGNFTEDIRVNAVVRSIEDYWRLA